MSGLDGEGETMAGDSGKERQEGNRGGRVKMIAFSLLPSNDEESKALWFAFAYQLLFFTSRLPMLPFC